jgi:hypothetical protein
MFWLTWRQHRSQLLITGGLLLGLGTFLLVHGIGNANVAESLAGNPAALANTLANRFRPVNDILGWLPLAPAAIGLFWGAPVLAKEFERGTHKLAWTQSVSRQRWLAVKLGGLSAIVVLAGLAFGMMMLAWTASFEGTPYADRFGRVGTFVVTGVLPAAWWLFAFLTGVAAGAVLRRTLPAIAITLAITVTAILAFFFLDVRAHYAPLEHAVFDGPAAEALLTSDAMIASVAFVDVDGRELPSGEAIQCLPNAGELCVPDRTTRQAISYHPPTRYWQFQWTETAILFAASLALATIAIAAATRRRL